MAVGLKITVQEKGLSAGKDINFIDIRDMPFPYAVAPPKVSLDFEDWRPILFGKVSADRNAGPIIQPDIFSKIGVVHHIVGVDVGRLAPQSWLVPASVIELPPLARHHSVGDRAACNLVANKA